MLIWVTKPNTKSHKTKHKKSQNQKNKKSQNQKNKKESLVVFPFLPLYLPVYFCHSFLCFVTHFFIVGIIGIIYRWHTGMPSKIIPCIIR